MNQILQSHLTELLPIYHANCQTIKLGSSPSWQVRLPLLRLRPTDVVIVFRAAGLLATLRVPLLRRPHLPHRGRRRALLDPRRRTSTCLHEVCDHSLATHGSSN